MKFAKSWLLAEMNLSEQAQLGARVKRPILSGLYAQVAIRERRVCAVVRANNNSLIHIIAPPATHP